MFREPECSINQTKFSVSRQTSMKWLPPPSVPNCCIAFALRSWTPSCSALKSFQPSQYEDSSTDSLYALKPTGISDKLQFVDCSDYRPLLQKSGLHRLR